MEFLHSVFAVFKFIFGLGALVGLVAIGLLLVWYVLHVVARLMLRHQPADNGGPMRKLFLES